MTLFQFGSYVFPNKYIQYDTYETAPNQRQDLDSYTDGYGVTQRNTLAHTKTQVQFTTNEMSGAAMAEIMSGITSNYTSYGERDATCQYYDPESQSMKSGHFYLDPSLNFKIKRINNSGVERYGEMTWLFIEY